MVLKCFSIVIGVLIAITGILSIVFSELIVHFLIESVYFFLIKIKKLRNFSIILNFLEYEIRSINISLSRMVESSN